MGNLSIWNMGGGASHLAAEDLTAELRSRIEKLIITYQDRREMLILNSARDVVLTEARIPQALGGTRPPTTEFFRTLRNLQYGYRALESLHPAEVRRLAIVLASITVS